MRILSVNTHDIAGGAAKAAWNLFKSYQARGHDAWMAVGEKHSSDPAVREIPHVLSHHAPWGRGTLNLRSKLAPYENKVSGVHWIRNKLIALSDPGAAIGRRMGREDFNFKGSWDLLSLFPDLPDIIQAHNLHGDYFDLRRLPVLSRQLPVVLTLHDAWLLSGHCAHSFGCERWKTGCGRCPDLTIPPPIPRDATAYNWRVKRSIYRQCRLYVSAPSAWMMEKVGQSMVAPAEVYRRVIPNGIDLDIFKPGDKQAARIACGLPQDAQVLLFAANGIQHNPFKDFRTLREALARVAEQCSPAKLILVALGEDAPLNLVGSAEVRFVPFQKETRSVIRYYQAADIYIHAARAETFPLTILEALACGTPVVASAVGGIPEQITAGETGLLVPPEDAAAMSQAVQELLKAPELRCRMGQAGVEVVRRKYSLERQVSEYLDWYAEILDEWRPDQKMD